MRGVRSGMGAAGGGPAPKLQARPRPRPRPARGGWRLVLLAALCLASWALLGRAQASAARQAEAWQPPAAITVVCDESYPPYVFLDEEGRPQGIVADQWKLWERRTGVKVMLVAMDWGDAQRFMLQGKADVIDTIFMTEERRKNYDFTKPYATLEVPIFFFKNISGITELSSLKWFTVGVKEGDACIEVLHANGIYNLKVYPSYEKVIQAAAQREIKVFCVDKPPALYYLYKYNLEKEFKHSKSLYSGQFHRAVTKGSAALLTLVEEGFARITPEEYEAIDRKWMGSALGADPKYYLYSIYALAAVIAIGLGLAAWNHALRRKVAQKTAELRSTLELKEASEEKYRELVESAGSIILKLNGRGEIIFLNEFGRGFLGLAAGDAGGRSARGLKDLTDGLLAGAGDRQNLASEIVRADGERVWVSWTVRARRDPEGGLLELFCVGLDITQRKRAEDALRESEAKRRVVLDESTDPIFSFERDGAYRFVNKAFAAPFGKEPEEIIGRKIWDIFPPEEAEKRFSVVKEVFASGQTRVIEVRVPQPVNDLFFVTSVKPVKDEQGRVTSVICIAKDITERKRGEEALKESEERFRVLSEESPLGISLISQDGRYEYLNPAFIKMFGYTLEDIATGADWFRRAYPDPAYRAQVRRAWRDDLAKAPLGQSRPRTFEVRCADGGSKTVLFMPVTISSGRQFVLYADMTERLLAEQAQRESERRYRELFDSIDDFIYTHDLQGKVLTINQAACRSIGYDSQELRGKMLNELMAPALRQGFFDYYLPEVIAKGQIAGVTKYLARDGQIHYIEYRSRLIREKGQEPFVSGAGRDVTERIIAERELRRLEEQLFRSQKIEALGVLAGGIAHDFNNVLQAISGYTQLLLAEGDLRPASRERLESIGRSIERAARMIKQLMTLARKVETRRERVDLNQEIRQTVSILEHALPRMIGIRAELDPGLKPIAGDPGQVEQVMLNLATNAGHAMPQGGELLFRTRNAAPTAEELKGLPGLPPGDQVVLEVADTGLGMDEETMSHIFEPFFTTKPPGEGTGLGLSTVYGIVSNHGGQIYCRSQPGRGTTFIIYFPVAADHVERPAEVAGGPTPNLAGSETILLVDDEQAILESCQEALEGFGYRVLTAPGGAAALNIFLQDPEALDLVIMDLNMPGMGGLDAMRAMLEARPAARIMVATGNAALGIEETVSRMGGAGLLPKPYAFSDLLAKIREALERD